MFCNRCGKKIKAGAKVCSCGEPVEKAEYCGGFWGLVSGPASEESKGEEEESSFCSRDYSGINRESSGSWMNSAESSRDSSGTGRGILVGVSLFLFALVLSAGVLIFKLIFHPGQGQEAGKAGTAYEETEGSDRVKDETKEAALKEELAGTEKEKLEYRKNYLLLLMEDFKEYYQGLTQRDLEDNKDFNEKTAALREEYDGFVSELDAYEDNYGSSGIEKMDTAGEDYTYLVMAEITADLQTFGKTQPKEDPEFDNKIMFTHDLSEASLKTEEAVLLEVLCENYEGLEEGWRDQLIYKGRLKNLEVMLTDYYIEKLPEDKKEAAKKIAEKDAAFFDSYDRAEKHYNNLGDQKQYLKEEERFLMVDELYNKEGDKDGREL